MREQVLNSTYSFHKNLKSAIKMRGYDLTTFPEQYLGCTYQAFNWRLKKGKFLLKDVFICINMLDVTFDQLTKSREIEKPLSPLVQKKKKKAFSKLNNLLS